MNSKTFSQRFNRELVLLEFPEEFAAKRKAVSDVFGITGHLAYSLIFGHVLPAKDLLDKIAKILEVCPMWLGGASDKRKNYSGSETADSV